MARVLWPRPKWWRPCLTAKILRGVAKRYGWSPGASVSAPCHYCGAPGEITSFFTQKGKPIDWPYFSLQLDHVVPHSKGGPTTAENLVHACSKCNYKKGAMVWPGCAS